MKPGVSRLSTMQSPEQSKSRFNSFKRSFLSFVKSPSQREIKKDCNNNQRRSFPTPATVTSPYDTPVTATPSSTSTRKRTLRRSNDLPPPPFSVDSPPNVSSPRKTPQAPKQQRKQRVFKNGKLFYEWEQNSTHITIRLPSNWTSNSSRYLLESNDIKVLIAPSFLQVGIIHKKQGQAKPRLEWKIHHTTGGTIQVQGSTWTTPEEHQLPGQGTIITLCKAKPGIQWPYAILHTPREEVQTKLCRPPRTKQPRPRTKPSTAAAAAPPIPEEVETTGPPPSSSFNEQHTPPPPPPAAPKSPAGLNKKKKKKKTVSAPPPSSPSPNPRRKKRVSAGNKKRVSATKDLQQQESAYFQEKQMSGRRSGGEYSFSNKPPPSPTRHDKSTSNRTYTTKPTSESSLQQECSPVSPRSPSVSRKSSLRSSFKNSMHSLKDSFHKKKKTNSKNKKKRVSEPLPKIKQYESEPLECPGSPTWKDILYKNKKRLSEPLADKKQLAAASAPSPTSPKRRSAAKAAASESFYTLEDDSFHKQQQQRPSEASRRLSKENNDDDHDDPSYSLKPSFHKRLSVFQATSELHSMSKEASNMSLDIYQDQQAKRRSSAGLDDSESKRRSSFFNMLNKQGSMSRFHNSSSQDHQEQAAAVRRRSSAGLDDSSSRRSSFFNLQGSSSRTLETPKRFSKPTSRISMEIKSPNSTATSPRSSMIDKNDSSSRSIINNGSSSRSIGGASSTTSTNKPPSRISQQIKQRLSNGGGSGNGGSTTIIVPSKASQMDLEEAAAAAKKKKKQKKQRAHSNCDSLDFVGHHDDDNIMEEHYKRTSLTTFLSKPNVPSNLSGWSDSQFRSVSSANTSTRAMVNSTLQGWKANLRSSALANDDSSQHSHVKGEELPPFDDSLVLSDELVPTPKNQQAEEDQQDSFLLSEEYFMKELEMSYSRISTLV